MHLARLAGFEHQPDAPPRALADQVVMQPRRRQQRRNRRVFAVHALVGENQHRGAVGDGLIRRLAQYLQRRFQPGLAVRCLEDDGQGGGGKPNIPAAAQFLYLSIGQDGELEANLSAVLRLGAQQIALRSEGQRRGGDQFFADGIERRVGHLGEQLLEIVVEELRLVGQHGQRRIGAHRTHRLDLVHRHRADVDAQVLKAVAERLLPLQRRRVVVRGRFLRHVGQLVEMHQILVQPLAIRVFRGSGVLDFLVADDAPLFGVHQEHAPRLQPLLQQDALRLHLEDTDFGGHDDQIVLGDVIARRPQAIAVEHGADPHPVGEGD